MSTFNGIVKEFPFIRIDRFNKSVGSTRIFLISHCHSDHMEGLDDNFFKMLGEKRLYLYASPISARILKNRYPGCDNQLKVLCVGELTTISTDFNGETVYFNIFVIPAGHCPGSVMFLIEVDNVRILYTGDFRIDKTEEFFKKYFKSFQKINNIYLDTTFCKKTYPYFPSRKETAESVCEIIDNWLKINENHIIYIIVPALCGSEYIFTEIFKKTRQKLLVCNNMYDLHKFMPEMDNIVKCDSDDTNENIRIHVKLKSSCNPINSLDDVCQITITAMIWEDYQTGESIIKCENVNNYRVCASYHPSYTEICEFIDYLKPIDIEPCVLPKHENERKNMMDLLNSMKNQYKKIGQDEIFKIRSTSFSKPLRQKGTKLATNVLSSPPRKFSRKRCLDSI